MTLYIHLPIFVFFCIQRMVIIHLSCRQWDWKMNWLGNIWKINRIIRKIFCQFSTKSINNLILTFFRSLEPKRESIDSANEDPKPTTAASTLTSAPSAPTLVPAISKPPEDPRCKVCFKQIGDSEYFRVCSGCVRRVCEDCSASYTSKDEPEVRYL